MADVWGKYDPHMSLRLLLTSPAVRLGRAARLIGDVPLSSRVLRGTAFSLALGAFSLVDPHRLDPWQRTGHRMISGALAGAVGADLAREDPIVDPVTDSVLLAGAALALAGPAEELDGWAQKRLGELGITHPRWIFAALGAGMTAATYALASRQVEDEQAWHELAHTITDELRGELDPRLRAVIEAMLAPAVDGADGADLPGAAALREQLGHVRQLGDRPFFDTMLVFEDPALTTLPRAVPRQQTWPVSACFDRDGRVYRLELLISDGLLAAVTATTDQAETPVGWDMGEAELGALVDDPTPPAVDELELVVESEDPSSRAVTGGMPRR